MFASPADCASDRPASYSSNGVAARNIEDIPRESGIGGGQQLTRRSRLPHHARLSFSKGAVLSLFRLKTVLYERVKLSV